MRFTKAGAGSIVLALVFFFVWQYHSDFIRNIFSPQETQERPTIFVDDIPVRVDVADTPEERIQGLSGRDSLEWGEGMLFIFEEEGKPGFWMKDMNVAIDIIWISSRGEIVDVDAEVTPDTYPTAFTPQAPAQYVLEVPAGFAEANEIQIGSKINLDMLQ